MPDTHAIQLGMVSDHYVGMYERRDREELALVARVKRFVERWAGDAKWRSALATSPSDAEAAFAGAGIDLDPAQVACTWHSEGRTMSPGEAWRAWERWIGDMVELRDLLGRAASTEKTFPRFERWRQRQIQWMKHELDPVTCQAIPNVLVAYELARGCSVGCWFCGVSADKFEDACVYDEPTAALWQGIVSTMVARFGTAAGTGFCYWATDPSDTPDYLAFSEDHRRLTGWRPQITTARPFASLALLAEIMHSPREHRHINDRFSVLTKSVLDRLHAEFDSDSLLHVDLVMQMKGATMQKAKAGRARQRNMSEPISDAPFEQGSIACVTGFLINLRERRLRMVSPCCSSERWPDGYRVFGDCHFEDTAGFAGALDQMLADNVLSGPHPAAPLAINASVKVELDPGGMVLRTASREGRVGNYRFLPRLVEMLRAGKYTEAELVCAIGSEYPDDQIAVPALLRDLFEHGVLDDFGEYRPAQGAVQYEALRHD